MKKILSFLIVFALLFALSVPALASEGGYTYTVRVYAGNMGTINGQDMVEYTSISYGEEWSFDIAEVEITNPKYYVRGIRESGLDNETVSSAAIRVERDIEFVVAYGIKGRQVAYTVSFVSDSDGEELEKPVTYYGNVGDKPVVACKFIDGYFPRYYNITGTLKENAAENVFEFRYIKVEPTPVSAPESSQTPGESSGTPGESSGTPGESSGTPGESSGTPGESSGTPGESSGTPGESSGTPGESSGTPGESSGTPGESSGTPGESSGNPGESSGSSGESSEASSTPGGESSGGESSVPSGPEEILDIDVPQAGPDGGRSASGQIIPIVLGSAGVLGLLALILILILRRRKRKE